MELHSHPSARMEPGPLRASLLRTARRLSDGADAEDLVQEAITRALERSTSLRPDTDLRAWARVVMRNLAIDQVRKSRRLRPLDGVEPASSKAKAMPAWMRFDRGDIERALGCCAPELRTAFELHYWKGRSLNDIAEHLSVPRSTVGTRLFRARAQVRRALEDDVGKRPCPGQTSVSPALPA